MTLKELVEHFEWINDAKEYSDYEVFVLEAGSIKLKSLLGKFEVRNELKQIWIMV